MTSDLIARVLPSWLSMSEVDDLIALAGIITYSTVRGPFRMAPVAREVLEAFPPIDAFLDGQEPYGAYILVYEPGAVKEPHRDPQLAHERVVCCLQRAEKGGMLVVDTHTIVPLGAGDACQFRADLVEHHVTEVREGKRIVLTVGRPV